MGNGVPASPQENGKWKVEIGGAAERAEPSVNEKLEMGNGAASPLENGEWGRTLRVRLMGGDEVAGK